MTNPYGEGPFISKAEDEELSRYDIDVTADVIFHKHDSEDLQMMLDIEDDEHLGIPDVVLKNTENYIRGGADLDEIESEVESEDFVTVGQVSLRTTTKSPKMTIQYRCFERYKLDE